MLFALEGQRSIANLRGGFTEKTINGRRYWYFQYRDIRQGIRQVYIGPDNETTRRFVERFRQGRTAVEADERRIAAFHAKAAKDRAQAAQLLEVLIEERPFDLENAWSAVSARGRRWSHAALAGLEQLEKSHASLVAKTRKLFNHRQPLA